MSSLNSNNGEDGIKTADLKKFFDRYWKLIYDTARKAGLKDVEAQEVIQEVIISAAHKRPKLDCVAAKDLPNSWLMQLIRWHISEKLRKGKDAAT